MLIKERSPLLITATPILFHGKLKLSATPAFHTIREA